ncbi:MAB_1171c family putative transporter [Nonomuraea sp. bgisy101]|uniref:MAB_1171c family putative transporter n=1 Tax=Nonomuraea sp. bgisy101 TaxID=3413784 RepID=UPI003D73F88F
MPSLWIAVCLGIMILIVAIRTGGLRQSPKHLMIWLACLSGVVSMLITVTPLRSVLIEVTGTPAVALIIESGTSLGALTGVMAWVCHALAEQGGPLSRLRKIHYLWYAAGLWLCVLAAIALTNDLSPVEIYNAVGEQRASDAQLWYLGLYEITLPTVFAIVSWLFLRLARRCDQRWLRRSLQLMAVGSIGSSARSLYTLSYLAPQVLDIAPPPLPWSTTAALAVNFLGYTVGFIGLSLPVVEQWRQRPKRMLGQITPLWHDLTRAVPEVVRIPQSADTVDAEVAARTIVISEALLRLRSYSHPEDLQRAREQNDGRVPAGRREEAGYAAWIHDTVTSIEAKRADGTLTTPAPQPAMKWPPHPRAGQMSWLLDVAREYNRVRPKRPSIQPRRQVPHSW